MCIRDRFYVADYRVPAQASFRFQVDVERTDELRCQFVEGDVLLAIIGGDKPVSYTHLDVYKRQGFPAIASFPDAVLP